MVLLDMVVCQYTIRNLSPPHKKQFQFLNYNELLYTITFNYVTFATLMNGPAYVIAVDYDRYVILKYCFFESDQLEFVSFKYISCTN